MKHQTIAKFMPLLAAIVFIAAIPPNPRSPLVVKRSVTIQGGLQVEAGTIIAGVLEADEFICPTVETRQIMLTGYQLAGGPIYNTVPTYANEGTIIYVMDGNHSGPCLAVMLDGKWRVVSATEPLSVD